MASKRFPNHKDILDKVQEVEGRHNERKRQHELDQSLWRLDAYVLDEVKARSLIKEEDYPSFTSNAPRTLSRVMMAMLNKNKVRFKFMLPPDVSEEEEDIINNNERLIVGALYDVDRVRSHNDESNLQWAISWYITHRGGAIAMPKWVPENKRNQWQVMIPDPFDCAWDKGSDCLDFFVHHYRDEKATVEATWDVSSVPVTSDKLVDIYDCWWIEREEEEDDEDTDDTEDDKEIKTVDRNHVVWNAVVVGSVYLKKPTAHSEFVCNPIIVRRAGGTPSTTNIGSIGGGVSSRHDAMSDQWESIYSGVRETIGWMNRIVTLYGIYLRNGAIGPYIYKGRKNKSIKKSLKPFQVVTIDVNEEFGPMAQPQMAQEAKELLDFVRSEWQKAGVSDIVFGDVPFTVSGFGMVQLRGAVEVLVAAYINAIEEMYVSIATELTQQFVKLGGKRKISIKGIDGRSKEFMTKITPQDIEKEYIITATLDEGLPKDLVQVGNAASLWRQSGAPLSEIFENVFEFDDAGEKAREALREKAEEIPEVMLTRVLAALVKGGNNQEAMILAKLIQPKGGANAQSGAGPDAANPGQSNAPPGALPPEVAGFGEQAGEFPEQPVGPQGPQGAPVPGF